MTTPKLQHELKKKRPFESLEEEAALNIVRTSDQLQIRFARLLREYGLTSPTQYNILRILRGEGKPLPILEIAARTITVVPGITGLWQVSGRNNTTYAERVAFDEYYVRNWSIWLDLYILAKTVHAVATGDGAY